MVRGAWLALRLPTQQFGLGFFSDVLNPRRINVHDHAQPACFNLQAFTQRLNETLKIQPSLAMAKRITNYVPRVKGAWLRLQDARYGNAELFRVPPSDYRFIYGL